MRQELFYSFAGTQSFLPETELKKLALQRPAHSDIEGRVMGFSALIQFLTNMMRIFLAFVLVLFG